MKNQINISNLTPEQIEDLRQQLKAFDGQPKSIMDRVKSWGDAKNIVKPTFWLDSSGEIDYGDDTPTENHVPSEKHAKSLLATSQLMVIAEALNEGNICNKVGVYWDGQKFQCSSNSIGFKSGPIRFKNTQTAEHTIAKFPELWYDYFMIDKTE